VEAAKFARLLSTYVAHLLSEGISFAIIERQDPNGPRIVSAADHISALVVTIAHHHVLSFEIKNG
jgi:hypothetical protein